MLRVKQCTNSSQIVLIASKPILNTVFTEIVKLLRIAPYVIISIQRKKNANIRSRPQYKSQAIHTTSCNHLKKKHLFIVVYHRLQAPLHKDLKA